MTDKQVRNHDKFMLRLPDGMRDAIAERARRNGRSMNSEIVKILSDAVESPAKSSTPSLNEMRSFINKLFDEELKKGGSGD